MSREIRPHAQKEVETNVTRRAQLCCCDGVPGPGCVALTLAERVALGTQEGEEHCPGT